MVFIDINACTMCHACDLLIGNKKRVKKEEERGGVMETTTNITTGNYTFNYYLAVDSGYIAILNGKVINIEVE